ncbi:putative ribonuclease H-like domain-containing protein [Tanacetum coccineum]|uniref:Ribonuclease H-like domain-containing protein n=1 Tax=Tanacetum coccineum TaxID=301880 RepID=A0ABQ5AQM4_9ASTR
MSMLVKDIRSQDGKDDKDKDQEHSSLNDKSNLTDLMKEYDPFSGSTTNTLPPSSSPVKTSDNFEKFADELAPLDSLLTGNDDSTLKKDFHEVNFQVYSNPLFEFDDSFKSSNMNPLFEENDKDVEIKSSSSSTLTSPEESKLEAYLEKDSIPPGIDLTFSPTFKVSSSNPTFPTLTGEKVCSWKTPMFFSMVRFVWKMMTRNAIRKKIICILATFLNKKPKPLSRPQEVEEIKEKEDEISSDVQIHTIVMPIQITFDNPIDFNDHLPKDFKKDLTVSFDSIDSSILPPPLLDSDSPFTAGLSLFFKEPSFLLPPPKPPDECLKNVVLHEDFYQSKKTLPLNVKDVDSFTFIIWTFLPYFTYTKESPLIFSFRKPKTFRKNSFRSLVIEDWNSDDDSQEECIPNVKDKTVRPSTEKIKFVKSARETVEKTECLILSPDFKLLDESQVLLKVPRQNNMYSFNLKNVVPSGGLTCLFAKATIDESNLWHRRLGHVNFKTMNKLVRGNLVRGLPSKLFENDHTCVACQKGKQHKASCKTKLVSSISQPLQMLHMDLFGPTFVKSLNKKMYCLVVTDDFSRFSWVFFLASKDETSGILKTFITGIENQINHKVKIIRCDNGTEFKNSEMNQFCEMKGIKREFSVARTPQQNGVAERKNRTLIEAARTMLADSLLPTTFWAEAINTACYVQNRVLITKPHNKTPYELLIGRSPNLDFMRPFGCPVTILNTLDHLGKFEGKADEGFLVGYSVNSKAFRVFNTRTKKVEENLHIKFLENKPNVAGSGPEWLFDIDSLTKSMNYEPEKASNHEYILLPFLTFDFQGPRAQMMSLLMMLERRMMFNIQQNTVIKMVMRRMTNRLNNVSPSVSAAGQSFDNNDLPTDPLMPDLEDFTGIFRGAYDDEDVGAEADLNNLETTMNVSPIPTTRIHKVHPKDQIIGDINSAIQTRRMINFSEENAMVRYISKQRRTNHKD